jgi:hypothetical protein
MSDIGKNSQFTWADIQQWVERGLIRPDQARNIRKHVEAAGPVAEQVQTGVEQRKGLNLVTIANYFGGFLVLLAYTVFIGTKWGSLDSAAQAGVSLLTIGVLWTIGFALRYLGYVQAGGLLIFAGTGVFPLLVYTLERMIGARPAAGSYAYGDFYYRTDAPIWIVMEVTSIFVATIILWRIRFSLLVLLIAFWSWFLSMDLLRWITQSPTWSWGDQEQLVSTLIGVFMLALGIFLQRRTRQDYSLWFYTFGHLIVFTHLTALLLDNESALGLLYLMIYLAFVVASVWLQRRVFLVFGAIGSYGYISFLAFDVFEGSLGFVFALAGAGLAIILTTVGYQKYIRPWLEGQLTSYQKIR